jgi:hypothetical protein
MISVPHDPLQPNMYRPSRRIFEVWLSACFNLLEFFRANIASDFLDAQAPNRKRKVIKIEEDSLPSAKLSWWPPKKLRKPKKEPETQN